VILHSFDGLGTGSNPTSGLTFHEGALYGTTTMGGPNNLGTIFKILTDGSGFQTIAPFDNVTTGMIPSSDLIFLDGWIYGTAREGGTASGGTLFRFLPDLTQFEVVYEFQDPVGPSHPNSLLAVSGVLYGTTDLYGPSDDSAIFKINSNGGGFQVLKTFAQNDPDGSIPQGLISLNGVLYGTTLGGGALNSGTIFQIDTTGLNFTSLHSFGGSDGQDPDAELIVVNGILFGTTRGGGGSGLGSVFRYAP
jgi:uncharacterized repeat protein (TIGR03803 family)